MAVVSTRLGHESTGPADGNRRAQGREAPPSRKEIGRRPATELVSLCSAALGRKKRGLSENRAAISNSSQPRDEAHIGRGDAAVDESFGRSGGLFRYCCFGSVTRHGRSGPRSRRARRATAFT